MSDSSELDEGHRRFPPPWTVEPIQVKDANGQSLAYVYGRETQADADIAHVLTMDEARRVASNIAKLPSVLMAQSYTIERSVTSSPLHWYERKPQGLCI